MDEDNKMVLSEAVEMTAWTHNTNVMMRGKILRCPRISQGNEATESVFEDEGVRRIMERHFEAGKQTLTKKAKSKIE